MQVFKLILLSLVCSSLCNFSFSYSINFVNESGIDDKNVHIQIIVQGVGFWDFKSKAWNNADSVQAASVTLSDIKDTKYVVDIDDSRGNHGGKVYVSFGGPTSTRMVGEQYVSPVPGDVGTENIVFDKIEMGLSQNAVVNQTSVDFVALPLGFQVDGKPQRGFTCTRSALMNDMAVALKGTGFESLLVQKNNIVTAVKNPTCLGPYTTVIDQQIKDALPPNSKLKVATSESGMVAFETDADRNIKCDNITIPFDSFTSFAVLCNAPQTAIQNPSNIFGAISAYILRGVDLDMNTPESSFSSYKDFPYTADPYAKIIHDNCIDNRGYAFGYDDTGTMDFSSSESRDGKGFTVFINNCSDLKDILNLK